MNSKPCSNCPFRSDKYFYLSASRKKEIAESIMHDSIFQCHKTTKFNDDGELSNPDTAKPCIGAVLFLENVRAGGALANLGFRLCAMYKKLDLSKLDRSAKVYKSIKEFLKNE